jgi:hypothetical protein
MILRSWHADQLGIVQLRDVLRYMRAASQVALASQQRRTLRCLGMRHSTVVLDGLLDAWPCLLQVFQCYTKPKSGPWKWSPTGESEGRGDPGLVSKEPPPPGVLSLCVQRQAAAVGVLLSFLRFGILAFEISAICFHHVTTNLSLPQSVSTGRLALQCLGWFSPFQSWKAALGECADSWLVPPAKHSRANS